MGDSDAGEVSEYKYDAKVQVSSIAELTSQAYIM